MEAIRLFDRKTFDWIRDNRDMLMGEDHLLPINEDDEKSAAEELVQNLSVGARAEVVTILRILFPMRVHLFGHGRGAGSESSNDVLFRRGIATSPAFTAYFSLSAPTNVIPKRMVDQATTSNVSKQGHCDLIDCAINMNSEQGESLILDYLQEINCRILQISLNNQEAILEALIEKFPKIWGG